MDVGFRRDQRAQVCHFWAMSKLTSVQIKSSLARVPEWKKKGATIVRTFVLKDFVAALKFVNAAGKLAEQAWHHPDIDIRWNKVTLALTTHDQGGLTKKDFRLARQFDRLK
jgi:4a-hydroxytetrahydrobiopterin dehydratase